MDAEAVDRLLASKKAPDRLKAVEWIIQSEDPVWNQRLIGQLSTKPHYIAELAASTLRERVTLEDAPVILDEFIRLIQEGDQAWQVCSSLAFILGKLEFWPAESALRQGIRTFAGFGDGDRAAGLRANCALALAEM